MLKQDDFWNDNIPATARDHYENDCALLSSLCSEIKKAESKNEASLLLERMKPYLAEVRQIVQDGGCFDE